MYSLLVCFKFSSFRGCAISCFTYAMISSLIVWWDRLTTFGLRQATKCARACAKCMRRVPTRSFLYIQAIYSSQWFCWRIVKALIRLRGCAGWSGPSLSAYAQRQALLMIQWSDSLQLHDLQVCRQNVGTYCIRTIIPSTRYGKRS